jgi:hypothetical protein
LNTRLAENKKTFLAQDKRSQFAGQNSMSKHQGHRSQSGARRMAETAAHLVDHVLPDQPIRQFVLTFPFQLRPLLAVRPKIMGTCLEISQRATSAYLLKKAGLSKTTGVTGGVTLIQVFGGACNVNIHFHQLLIDGAYELNAEKIPEDFHKIAPPTIPFSAREEKCP